MTRVSFGDCVRVLAFGKEDYVRIPHYIRHHKGRVSQNCGTYLNPEDLAVGDTSGRTVDLYRVEFPQAQLWSDVSVPPQDTLIIAIYDHWLIPAREATHAP